MSWCAFKKDYFIGHKEDFYRGASIYIQELKTFTSFKKSYSWGVVLESDVKLSWAPLFGQSSILSPWPRVGHPFSLGNRTFPQALLIDRGGRPYGWVHTWPGKLIY